MNLIQIVTSLYKAGKTGLEIFQHLKANNFEVNFQEVKKILNSLMSDKKGSKK